MAADLVIAVDDPGASDVRALLDIHRAFARRVTPVEYSFALDADQLRDPAVTFFSVRRDGAVVAVGALKRLDATHAELKSMHVIQAERGHGVGTALLEHLLSVARRQGYRRVSLETGTMDEFAPARALYSRAGFLPCAPFGDYAATPYNTCMSLGLVDAGSPLRG